MKDEPSGITWRPDRFEEVVARKALRRVGGFREEREIKSNQR